MQFHRSFLILILAFGISHLWGESQVELSLNLDRELYPELAESSFYLEASLRSSNDEAIQNRPPLNLCLVIDRSGSMAGDRIEFAKEAIHQAIGTLAESDVVSVVTFGSQSEILIPAQHNDRLTQAAPAIQSIEAVGGTALFDALNQAASQLRRYRTAQSLNRIILLSDGPPTRGPREIDDFENLANTFANEKITISAIGLGQEFNEDILTRMTNLTSGNYYFVAKGDQLTDTFKQEIELLNTAIARNIRLEIEFRNTIELDDPLTPASAISRRTVKYYWDTLYPNQTIRAILSGKIRSDGAIASNGTIAKATLYYSPIGATSETEITQTATAEADFIDSRRASVDSMNRATLRAAFALEIAASIRKAIEHSDNGEINKALKELRILTRDLKSINTDLEDSVVETQIHEIEIIYDQINTRGLDRIDRKVLTSRIQQSEIGESSINRTPNADKAGQNDED